MLSWLGTSTVLFPDRWIIDYSIAIVMLLTSFVKVDCGLLSVFVRVGFMAIISIKDNVGIRCSFRLLSRIRWARWLWFKGRRGYMIRVFFSWGWGRFRWGWKWVRNIRWWWRGGRWVVWSIGTNRSSWGGVGCRRWQGKTWLTWFLTDLFRSRQWVWSWWLCRAEWWTRSRWVLVLRRRYRLFWSYWL